MAYGLNYDTYIAGISCMHTYTHTYIHSREGRTAGVIKSSAGRGVWVNADIPSNQETEDRKLYKTIRLKGLLSRDPLPLVRPFLPFQNRATIWGLSFQTNDPAENIFYTNRKYSTLP